MAAPKVIFVYPFFPKLDCVLQALLWALATENGCIWDFKGFLQSVSHKFLNPLSEGLVVAGKTHYQRG